MIPSLSLTPARGHGMVRPAFSAQAPLFRAAFGTQHAQKPSSTPDYMTQAANLLNQQKHFYEYDGHGTLRKEVVLNANASFEGLSPQLWQHSFAHIQSTQPVQASLKRHELGILEEVSDLRYELIGLIAHKKGLIPQSFIDHVDSKLTAQPNTSVLTFLPEFKQFIFENRTLSQNATQLAKLVYKGKNKTNLDNTRTLMALTAIRYSQLGFATQGKHGSVQEDQLIGQLHGELAEMVSNLPLLNKDEFKTLLDDRNLTIQKHPRMANIKLAPNKVLSQHLRMVLTNIDNHETQVLAHEFQTTQKHFIGILRQTLGLQNLSNGAVLDMMDAYYLKKHLIRQEFNLILHEVEREPRKKLTKLFEAIQEAEIIDAARQKAVQNQPMLNVNSRSEKQPNAFRPQPVHA